jgi:hypothetical protein
MERLGIALFAIALLYSLLINVPFLVGELVYLGDDNTDDALVLLCVSWALNFLTLLAVLAGVTHAYDDVRIKSRGFDFLISVYAFSFLDLLFALLVVLTYLGKLPGTIYIGPNAAGKQPPMRMSVHGKQAALVSCTKGTVLLQRARGRRLRTHGSGH